MNWKVEKIADFIFESSFVLKGFLFFGTAIAMSSVLGNIFNGIGYVIIELFGFFPSYTIKDFSDFGVFLALFSAALLAIICTLGVPLRRIKISEKKESTLQIAGPEQILNLSMCARDGVVEAHKPFRFFVTEQPPFYLMVTNKRLLFLRQNHVLPFWGELYFSAFGVKSLFGKAGKIDEASSDLITPEQIKQLRSEFHNFREYFTQDLQDITIMSKLPGLDFVLLLKNGEEHKFHLVGVDFLEDLEEALIAFKSQLN